MDTSQGHLGRYIQSKSSNDYIYFTFLPGRDVKEEEIFMDFWQNM